MKNITYRTNYVKEENLDGFQEYDLGSMEFGNYDFGAVQYYMIKETDVGRPDIISQKIYGTTNYWWFVCWWNKISDPWNDLRTGMVISYPSIERIREALKLYNKD